MQSDFKTFKNFKQGDFCSLLFVVLILMQPFAVLRIPAAPRPIPSSGIGTTAVSLRYRIEAAEKDLGTLSQTLLENFLKEVFKTFKNFKQGDFCPLLFVCTDFNVAGCRAANSGCSRAAFRQRNAGDSRLSPLPDRKSSG